MLCICCAYVVHVCICIHLQKGCMENWIWNSRGLGPRFFCVQHGTTAENGKLHVYYTHLYPLVPWMCHTLAVLFNYVSRSTVYSQKTHPKFTPQKTVPFQSQTRHEPGDLVLKKLIGFVVGVRSRKHFQWVELIYQKTLRRSNNTVDGYKWFKSSEVVEMVHIPRISHEMTMVSINSTGHNWSIVVSVKGGLGIYV